MTTVTKVSKISLLGSVKGHFFLGLLAMMIGAALQLTVPMGIGVGIDEFIQRGTSAYDLGQLFFWGCALAAIFCTAGAIRFYCFDVAGNKLITLLRRQLFKRLLNMPAIYYDSNNIGELNSRFLSDVESLKHTLTVNFAITLRSMIVFVGGVALLISISPTLSLLVTFLLPAIILMAKILGSRIRTTAKNMQQSSAESMHVLNESLTNFKLLKAFNRIPTQQEKYHSRTHRYLSLAAHNALLMSYFKGASTFVTICAVMVVLWAGGYQIQSGTLTAGELSSFIMYASMTSMSFTAMTGFWAEWQRAQGATERVFDILNEEDQQLEQTNAKPMALSGWVELESVNFKYPSKAENTLKNINLKVESGQVIALVGPSGAGKSTIFNLIMGFYHPTSGRILMDNVPQAMICKSSLSQHIALVEQEPRLFATTIAENIAFSVAERECSRAEIESAAKLANLHTFISGLPKGYDTEVGPNGAQLSGGQKQRIAIARAILRNPSILLLDEATSALDSETEKQVQDALSKLMQGRTTFIIAHRLSTITHADNIVVLNNGEIIQVGKHSQLMNDNQGTYHKLITEQIKKIA